MAHLGPPGGALDRPAGLQPVEPLELGGAAPLANQNRLLRAAGGAALRLRGASDESPAGGGRTGRISMGTIVGYSR